MYPIKFAVKLKTAIANFKLVKRLLADNMDDF